MGVYSNYTERQDTLAEVKIKNFSESLSIIECSMYALSESELTWNSIMESVAIEELAVLESTGQEMVYEAENKEGFFAKIIAWFKEKWAMIAGLFKKAIVWIESKVKDNKKFIAKYKAAIIDGYKNFPADGIDFKGYAYDNLYSIDYVNAANAYDKYAVEGQKYDAILSKSISDEFEATEEYVKSLKTNRDENLGKVRAAAINGDAGVSVDAKDFAKAIRKYLCGTAFTKIKAGDFKVDVLINEVEDAKEVRAAIKADYNKLKDFINKCIKIVDTAKKEVVKEKGHKEGNLKIAYASEITRCLKDVASIYATVNGIQLSTVTAKANQDKALATKLISFAAPAKKAEAKQESATFQSEEFESMFNLDLI